MSSQNASEIVVNESPAEATGNPTGNDSSGESNLMKDTQSSSQSGQYNTNNSSNECSQSRRGLPEGVDIIYCPDRKEISGTNPESYAYTTAILSVHTFSDVQVGQRHPTITSSTSTATTACHDEATEEDKPQ
ncbi:hypothetical protein ACJ73_02975 [Blastomyces percursus]|uniref:Uncharacterized protein n=1 Tax=Blastomyces percursus TaxID=1658174 RepID=A0A1J9RDB0_9EURO|nr:hypothetical protein ACJ73_02975 [Blastomyces percursus]